MIVNLAFSTLVILALMMIVAGMVVGITMNRPR
jgi:hypothetical protein